MLFEDALYLFRWCVDRIASRRLLKGHAEHMIARFGDDFVVVVLDLLFPLRGHVFLHCREYEVGRALEHCNLRRGFGHLGQHLYGGGASANNSNTLACHVEAFRPARGMEDRAFKAILPRYIR